MEKKRTRKALKKASTFSDQDFYVQSATCYPVTKYLHNVRAVIKRGGWGFPLATMNVAPGCFHRKIEENRTKRNP